ncbi:MAG: hypothetical protein NVSMB65_04880 [Chloroflexota bacterium]
MGETTPQRTLGELLKQSRELLGFSVRGAAEKAEISATYLSQLEAGTTKEPSPRVLYNLARVYDVSYADLMRAAGYVVPDAEEERTRPPASSMFDIALRTKVPITNDERAALAEYLAWYRARHGHPPEVR